MGAQNEGPHFPDIPRHLFGRSKRHVWFTFALSRCCCWMFGELWIPLGCHWLPHAAPLGWYGLFLGSFSCLLCTGPQCGEDASSSNSMFCIVFAVVGELNYCFSIRFLALEVVKSAPQAQPKTTPNARHVVKVRYVSSIYVWPVLVPSICVWVLFVGPNFWAD